MRTHYLRRRRFAQDAGAPFDTQKCQRVLEAMYTLDGAGECIHGFEHALALLRVERRAGISSEATSS